MASHGCNIRKDKFITVKVIDIVGFIAKLPQRVKLLKLDVEGIEIEVLNKLIDTETINILLVETSVSGNSREENA